MTVEFVLFLSPEGIALAHRQQAGHWALIGDTALDVPDLGSALAGLREMGETRGGANFPTLLVLPDDQLLYTELDGLGGSAAIPGRLGGLTPYAVEELAYDWRDLGGGRAALAVVARETLDEAEGFARDNGFNGVGFAASPPVEKFPGVPLFQLADDARGLTMPDSGLAFGPDSWTPVVDEISSAPDPVPDPAPEPVPEAPPVDDPAPEAPAEPELETAPPDEVDDTPDLTPVVKSRTARQGKASSAPAAPPAPDDASQDDPTDTPDDGPMQMPTGFGARRGKAPAPEGRRAVWSANGSAALA
ncbi:hypothetical protein E2K80_09450 [Rhodophyticola sp. CCM32]|uniref:hypothetical protein n=1 Tax=Rhodophyticola sp. CCM32 TaxID=2916397 RepID=UPI00107FC8D0|nr:hypothetical protein [Rhodophyticola sp. CCM32]QBY00923.1 hypothetical protein E2K80_09450 [Rhodophyticola sp. CCM32]